MNAGKVESTEQPVIWRELTFRIGGPLASRCWGERIKVEVCCKVNRAEYRLKLFGGGTKDFEGYKPARGEEVR